MGFMDSIKGAIGIGSGSGEFDGEDIFEEETEGEEYTEEDEDFEEDGEFEEEIEEDNEEMVWGSAHDFSDWALEKKGFSNKKEFVLKVMCYRINNSMKFRDQIKNGKETMNMVESAMTSVDSIKGEDSSDPEVLAEKISGYNKLQDELDDFNDREEQMIEAAIQTAQDFASGLAGSNMGNSVRNIDTSITESNEEI